jgi:2-hydroxychromene-2-carboxylate isomerase
VRARHYLSFVSPAAFVAHALLERDPLPPLERVPVFVPWTLMRSTALLTPLRASEERIDYDLADATRRLHRLGLDPGRGVETFRRLRAGAGDADPCHDFDACFACATHVVASEAGSGDAFLDRAFRAFWLEGRIVTRKPVLFELAEEIGLAPALLARRIHAPDVRDAVVASMRAFLADGGFGVPFFVVGEEHFWGSDRIEDVRAALANGAGPASAPPEARPFALADGALCAGEGGGEGVLEFSFACPESALLLARFAQRRTPGESPLRARALALPEGGWAAAHPASKRACLRADVLRHAAAYGLPIPGEVLDASRCGARAAAAFPIACARGAGAAFAGAVARALWLDAADVDDAETLAAVLARAGLDPALAGADPARAPRLGDPGAPPIGTPWLRLGGERFLGHDSILGALAAARAAGSGRIREHNERDDGRVFASV